MSQKVVVAALLLVAALSLWGESNDVKPTISKAPLSTDEIAVYRAFLSSYDNGAPGQLNVANVTRPLRLDNEKECMNGIALEDTEKARKTVHVIGPEVSEGKRVNFVDPEKQAKLVKENDPSRTIGRGKSVEKAVEDAFASGLLSISEVAFDKDHKYAVLTFSFYCGGLCGNGGTLVFEKVGNEWKPSKRSCGQWIS
jgi:hypothetical protein